MPELDSGRIDVLTLDGPDQRIWEVPHIHRGEHEGRPTPGPVSRQLALEMQQASNGPPRV